MSRIKFILISVISGLLLSGCGMSSNLSQNINQNQTSVVLSQANFHIVKTVRAEVSASYFLGIGGLTKKALRNNAVAELTKKADLVGSQALVNVTVKSSSKFIFIFSKTTFYAEGTVIEFER